jgi:hypothetical protein
MLVCKMLKQNYNTSRFVTWAAETWVTLMTTQNFCEFMQTQIRENKWVATVIFLKCQQASRRSLVHLYLYEL